MLRARLEPDAAGWTPLLAGLLLLIAELAFWSFELEGAPVSRAHLLRRSGLLLGLASAGAGVVAAVELAAAAVAGSGAGYGMLAAGVVAAVGCVLLLAVSARSARGRAT